MPVSRRMAESLWEAGFPQTTFLWWVYRRGEWKVTRKEDLAYNELALAAPNALEILRQLPVSADIRLFTAEALAEVYLQLADVRHEKFGSS